MWTDDLRHAWRRLTSRPAAIAAAVGMLGLGIGLSVATFSVLDALLFRPIPFHDPAELGQISMMGPRGGRIAVSRQVMDGWRSSTIAFKAVEAANASDVTVTTPRGPEVRAAARVTVGLFDMLGVKPMRGRAFLAGEGSGNRDDRAIISEDLWRSSFGADAGIIGRRVAIDGRDVEVIGVMPASVHFPAWNTTIWMPIDFASLPPTQSSAAPVVFVRRPLALPEKDALQIATTVARAADPSAAALTATSRPIVRGSRNPAIDRDLQQAAPLIAGGAGLVLLVLCANVCSLLLVRLILRQRELSVCTALGASRGRLLRQTFFEHMLLALVAIVVGLGLAYVLASLVRNLLPAAILVRSLNRIDLDLRAVWAACGAGAVCLILGGLIPAWVGTRLGRAGSIRLIDRGGTDSRGVRLMTRGLLVTETALSCTLLLAATVLVWSFVKMTHADRGLDTSHVVTSWVSLPGPLVENAGSRQVLIETIESTIRSMPGIARVAPSFGVPPSGGSIHFGKWSVDNGTANGEPTVDSYDVGAEFFELYRLPILRGRGFAPDEPAGNVVIGERLAAMFWPGQDPIGHNFKQQDAKTWMTVVGVTRDIAVPSLDASVDRPEYYEALATSSTGGPTRGGWQFMLNIKCTGACPEPVRIRERITATGPGVSVISLAALDDAYDAETARPRATAAVALIFAGIAIAAAAGGLFSVLSYVVGRRRREFGVRAALGADARRLRGLVFRDGFLVAGLGGAIGLAGGWALSRWIESMSYGVRVNDPIVWAVVVIAIVPTVIASCWRPAWRAGSVDPALLLREE
jgi:predicted permease